MTPVPYKHVIPSGNFMTEDQKSSFLNGYQTVMLPEGMELWRFYSQKKHERFGAFWIDQEAMSNIMQTIHLRYTFAEHMKKENVRNNLAIVEKWSKLSWRVKVRLQKEVIAYVGKIGPQKDNNAIIDETCFGGEPRITHFIEQRNGLQTQFVIPKFRDLPDVNPWAAIVHDAHI